MLWNLGRNQNNILWNLGRNQKSTVDYDLIDTIATQQWQLIFDNLLYLLLNIAHKLNIIFRDYDYPTYNNRDEADDNEDEDEN